MGKSIWDKEGAVEMAKDLRLKDGFSFGRIADVLTVKFNHRVTRNAVIGKFLRLGISGGPARPARKKMKPRNTPWGGKRAFIKPVKPLKPVQAAILGAPEPLPESRPDDIARVSFADYDHKTMCGFIPGDPRAGDAFTSKKYCGLPIVHGSPAPYCLEHLKRCFQPLPEPSRRPFVLYKPGVRQKEDA